MPKKNICQGRISRLIMLGFGGKNLVPIECITCLLAPVKDQEPYVEGNTKHGIIQASNARK